jgi:hypothetical protein
MLAYAEKNAADLENVLCFASTYRIHWEDIPHTRNNWLCYDFKERRIVPTHYTIRTNGGPQGDWHLKSWFVETSVDEESWREVAHEEDNEQLNDCLSTGTFSVVSGEECRFVRLVNIGRTHFGNDELQISAWEIFGTLLE